MIIRENKQQNLLKVLDVGTGSGCIPVTLAKHLAAADVYACDVSADALTIAQENAEANQVSVHFTELDFLQPETWRQLPSVDLLVSNPPYIRPSESLGMAAHVTGHEPHLALFVPGENALVFYEAIADFCLEKLNPGGKIYLEINEALGAETAAVFTGEGFNHVELRKDMSGKERFAVVRKS
jgi:release factor glutamine methyltransferase